MSDQPDIASQIKVGKLKWLLRTAMPLREDFNLYLNGEWLRPTKLDESPIKHWELGKDLIQLAEPSPEALKPFKRKSTKGSGEMQYGFHYPGLGDVTGFAEVYETPLTSHIDRSHGFFVYVRGRLVNPYDSHFGVPANLLRHGTFSRFRLVVNLDGLDDELRSSRELIRDTQLKQIAQNVLRGVFNSARAFLNEHDATSNPGFRAALRIAQTPGSLTSRPILGLLREAVLGEARPTLLEYPVGLAGKEAEEFIRDIEKKVDADHSLVCDIKTVELSGDGRIAVFDPVEDELRINALHPFVAAYRGDFERDDTLSLLCMAEVLTEAYLYSVGLEDGQVSGAVDMRDELLRQLARSMKRTANVIARDLQDSVTDQKKLELETVECFNSLGFDAIHIGGKSNPDGLATAHLAGAESKHFSYRASLEAKSKEVKGKKVEDLKISRIGSHRDKNECQYAVVVGADFSLADDLAYVADARRERENSGGGITLMRVHELARLVRLRAIAHLGLDRIRDLFDTCTSPAEVQAWVDEIETERPTQVPLRKILETIWEIQKEVPAEAVEFSAITTALRIRHKINLSKGQVIHFCKCMEQLAMEVAVRDNTVELTQPPINIIKVAEATISQFPDVERRLVLKW